MLIHMDHQKNEEFPVCSWALIHGFVQLSVAQKAYKQV